MLFLVSSIAKVSVERLSIMILPWLAVSLLVLFLVTYLPTEWVLSLANLLEERRAGPGPVGRLGAAPVSARPPARRP